MRIQGCRVEARSREKHWAVLNKHYSYVKTLTIRDPTHTSVLSSVFCSAVICLRYQGVYIKSQVKPQPDEHIHIFMNIDTTEQEHQRAVPLLLHAAVF